MKCEKCETVMQWRSTNQITHLSKFKCPRCGNVQIGENEVKYPVTEVIKEAKIPNFYHNKNGKYIVKRRRNHQLLYAGTYANEETAQKVVEELNKCDWDLDMIPAIYKKLNIRKVNRSWVCT